MDKSVKIALNARALNESIFKDEYQMPNLENLIIMIAEKLDKDQGEAWFPSVDMTYAYGQVPLHEVTLTKTLQFLSGESPQEYIVLQQDNTALQYLRI